MSMTLSPAVEAFNMFQQSCNKVDEVLGLSPYGLQCVNGSLSRRDRQQIENTFAKCVEFYNTHTLGGGGQVLSTAFESYDDTTAYLNQAYNASIAGSIGREPMEMLAKACNIDAPHLDEAVMAIAQLLTVQGASAGSKSAYRNQHFMNKSAATSGDHFSDVNLSLKEYFPSTLHNLLFDVKGGMEAFGNNIDAVTPDIRTAMTVTLLQFQRGLIKRILHTRQAAQPVVEYVIHQGEIYDLTASMSPTYSARNSSEHRIPLINLMANAAMVSNQLKPIIMSMDNDSNNVLVADGWIKPNVGQVCVLDLARKPGVVGSNQIDYSDLISEKVILDSIRVTLTKATTTETIQIPLKSFSRSRLSHQVNTQLSSMRGTIFEQDFKLTSGKKLLDGTDSVLLKDLTEEDCIQIHVNLSPMLNLMNGRLSAGGAITAMAYDKSGTPSQAVIDAMTGLTVTLDSYYLDMCYSEENLRKSSICVRTTTRTMTFEIPVGRNYMVDYAIDQIMPAQVLGYVNEVIALGQDDKCLRVITDVMKQVYDRNIDENADPEFRAVWDKIGFDYVASQLVRPYVMLANLDIGEVQNIRSADYLGDLRQYTETMLLNLLSKYNQTSYYPWRLNAGEKPVFKVVTSRLILENLLQIPHIHNHLQQMGDAKPADGEIVEYTRVLPSGVILEVATTSFDNMLDKMLIFPYRKQDPESVLNFGINHDMGMFAAHYNPQYDGGVYKRVFTNARTQVFPTNPGGLLITVLSVTPLYAISDTIKIYPDSVPLETPTA